MKAIRFDMTGWGMAAALGLLLSSLWGPRCAAADLREAVVRVETYTQVDNLAHQSVPSLYRYGTGLRLSDRWLLTAAHVIDGAKTLRVSLADGRGLPARIEGRDPRSDLALLHLEEAVPLGVEVRLAAPTLGEAVWAYGNAADEGLHVSSGVISFFGLTAKNRQAVPLIKSDAYAEPGFSGGPLVNAAGVVVGILIDIDRDRKGYSYAIDGRTAAQVFQALRDRRPIPWPALGLTVSPTQELREALSLELPVGLQVLAVAADSPLRGRLRPAGQIPYGKDRLPWGGDILVSLDGQALPSLAAAQQVLWTSTKPVVQLQFQRFDGGRYALELERRAQPALARRDL